MEEKKEKKPRNATHKCIQLRPSLSFASSCNRCSLGFDTPPADTLDSAAAVHIRQAAVAADSPGLAGWSHSRLGAAVAGTLDSAAGDHNSGLAAGVEAGFEIPEAGKDGEWLAENMGAFKARAEDGQEEFAGLVREVEERGLIAGHKTEAQKLEEMLGWGDSA